MKLIGIAARLCLEQAPIGVDILGIYIYERWLAELFSWSHSKDIGHSLVSVDRFTFRVDNPNAACVLLHGGPQSYHPKALKQGS